MQYHIETERLLLKPVAPEDVSAMFIWASDPEVNPYLSYPLHHDVSVMQKWIASLRPENLEFGFYRSEDGLLTARAVSVNAAMGFIIWATTSAAICAARGDATEAAKAMLSWGRRALGINNFAAEHALENIASGNVIRKCGFQLVRYGQYSKFDGSKTFDAAFYELHLKGES